MLTRLLNKTDSDVVAYQIAFDLYENATQQFINKIVSAISEKPSEER